MIETQETCMSSRLLGGGGLTSILPTSSTTQARGRYRLKVRRSHEDNPRCSLQRHQVPGQFTATPRMSFREPVSSITAAGRNRGLAGTLLAAGWKCRVMVMQPTDLGAVCGCAVAGPVQIAAGGRLSGDAQCLTNASEAIYRAMYILWLTVFRCTRT